MADNQQNPVGESGNPVGYEEEIHTDEEEIRTDEEEIHTDEDTREKKHGKFWPWFWFVLFLLVAIVAGLWIWQNSKATESLRSENAALNEKIQSDSDYYVGQIDSLETLVGQWSDWGREQTERITELQDSLTATQAELNRARQAATKRTPDKRKGTPTKKAKRGQPTPRDLEW